MKEEVHGRESMNSPEVPRKDPIKRIASNVLLILLSLIVCLFVGEVLTRLYLRSRPTNPNVGGVIVIDEQLGWRTAANFRFQGRLEDAAGRHYFADVRTDSRGSRLFGDLASQRRRVFFVGDSFTYAGHVSNDKTYYSIVNAALPQVEAFAYGGNGYGTLQELMIVDELIDVIQPDALVLQYCGNDIINNSYGLERRSDANNNGMRRPYLDEDGQVFYALPKGFFPRFREFANNYSRFLYLILSRVDRLYSNKETPAETLLFNEGRASPLVKDALDVTAELLREIRTRVPQEIEIYAFTVEYATHPLYEEFKRMSDLAGIEFIEEVPLALGTQEQKGTVVRAADNAHWNEKGHQIVADALVTYFANIWE